MKLAKRIFQITFIFLLLFVLITRVSVDAATGDKFKINNITYIVKSSSTVEVYKCDSSVVNAAIPFTVAYNGVGYKVVSIGNDAFTNCTSLKSISIPSGVTNIGEYSFYSCTSLKSITIPSGVTSIKNSVFQYCTSLTSITISDSITSIGSSLFYGCKNLKSIKLSENNKNYKLIDGNLYSKDGKMLLYYGIWNNDVSFEIPYGVTSIDNYAFGDCTSLKKVTIPDSVTNINICSFYNCTSLESIVIPKSVTNIEQNVFKNCDNLTIYCEASSKPSKWNANWNSSNRPVVWDYELEEEVVNTKNETINLFNSGKTGSRYANNSTWGRDANPDSKSLNNNGYDIFAGHPATVGMGLSFEISKKVTEKAKVTIYAYDVDEEDGEKDVIYLVDVTDGTKTKVGYLRGCDSEWNTTVIEIDPSNFEVGHTYRFELKTEQTGWCVWVRAVSINLTMVTDEETEKPVGPEITDYDFKASISSTGKVTTTLNIKSSENVTYNLEYIARINGDQKGSAFLNNCLITPSGNNFSTSFNIENGSPKGTYSVDVVIKDLQNNVLYTYSVSAGYAYNSVSYNSNGGSTNLPVDGNAYSTGDTVIVKFDYLPSRNGYKFLGWSTSSSATSAEFTKTGNKTFTISGSDVILYAVWQKNECKHNYELTETINNPSCTDKGLGKYTCSLCKNVVEQDIEPAGHEEGEWIIDVEATCQISGKKHTECTKCNKTINTSYVSKSTCQYESRVVKEVTCTTPGIIKHTCVGCNKSYNTYIYSEHEYVLENTVNATCTSDGTKLYKCGNCNHTYKEVIVGGHNYKAKIEKLATTTETGLVVYTCSMCQDSYEEIVPIRLAANILLIQDYKPWSEKTNEIILTRLQDEGYIIGWDLVTTSDLANVKFADYNVIFIANDQSTTTYNNLSLYNSMLETFAEAGGVVIYGACDKGWQGGNISTTLPGGVTKGNYYSYRNYIANPTHTVITGALTDGKALTNKLLYSTYSSHTYFNKETLPIGSIVLLEDGNGKATLVDVPYGKGRIIYSGLTWEYTYVRNFVDGTSFSKTIYDDLIVYASQNTTACSHAYDEGVKVEATCQSNGYTLHNCTKCKATIKENIIPQKEHSAGEWEIITEATENIEGEKQIKCKVCQEILQSETLPKLNYPVAYIESTTKEVICGQEVEIFVRLANSNLTTAVALVPEFDKNVFEYVSCEWLVEATLQNISEDLKAASAWTTAVDNNRQLFKLVLRMKTLTNGSTVNFTFKIENEKGVVDISVVPISISGVECQHKSVKFIEIDEHYHSSTCEICGYSEIYEHAYETVCSKKCSYCDHTRVAPHNMNETYLYDEEGHYHVCKLCGEKNQVVSHTFDDEKDMKCNDCEYERYILGDIDGKEGVTTSDAIYLLYHVMFGDVSYPVNQPVDYNKDNTVSINDAIQLLYHVMFGETYPLQ